MTAAAVHEWLHCCARRAKSIVKLLCTHGRGIHGTHAAQIDNKKNGDLAAEVLASFVFVFSKASTRRRHAGQSNAKSSTSTRPIAAREAPVGRLASLVYQRAA